LRIESFRIVNYKSFTDSRERYLEPGFNVIVGRNNVVKTALAEALSLRFSDKPHRSSKTVPGPDAQPDPESRADFDQVGSGRAGRSVNPRYGHALRSYGPRKAS
jgi:predicted ATP-dependent endonuclease of OLD family